MNIQDLINALAGMAPHPGALGQAISPIMPPAIAQQYGGTGTNFWGDLGSAAQGIQQSAPAIGQDLSALSAATAHGLLSTIPPDSPAGQYVANRLAAGQLQPTQGAPPPMGPGLGSPDSSGNAGNNSDLMTNPRPSLVPQTGPNLQYPAPNQGLLDIYNSGQGGDLTPPAAMPGPSPPPEVAGDVTDFPGRGQSAGGGLWDSILNALSPSQNADPTQNAELGANDPNWLYNTFGIGKAPVKPQEPGVLDQIAGSMNEAAANAPKAGAGKGGGSITTMGLGQYQEPPPAPHEAVPPGMDLSKVMGELRAAEPQRVPLSTTKGENILEGLAHGMASAAGHGFGTQLLAGAAGGLGGQIGYEHEQQRDEQNFQHAMQDFHYRMAEGELHQAQIGSEHDKLKAEIDYKNEMNDYQRAVSIITAHQPQAEMTAGGLVVRSINPKTGQYQVQIDSRPIDHIIAARMALRGMGASQAAVSSFTGLATGASGPKAGPEDAALKLSMDLLDRPGIWPAVLGPKFDAFNASVVQNMGKDSAYGVMSAQMKGKAGEAVVGARTESAVVRALQNMILRDPTGETAKRAVGLLTGQAVVGDKNAVVANPYHH